MQRLAALDNIIEQPARGLCDLHPDKGAAIVTAVQPVKRPVSSNARGFSAMFSDEDLGNLPDL